MTNLKERKVMCELRNLGVSCEYCPMIVNKKSLFDLGCIVKYYFNLSNFKSKTSGRIQLIKSVEVLEHGTVVYFWCSNMNNFIVGGNTKKETYKILVKLLADILFNEDENYFNVFTSLKEIKNEAL